MSESMRERVARALFSWNTGKAPYFVITSEFGREVPIDDPYQPIADAVLAVVADVEGIAGVLRAHRFDPLKTDTIYDYHCTCGVGLRKGQTATDHQAAVVVAYLTEARP